MAQVKKLLWCLKLGDVSVASQSTVCDGHISLCCNVSLQPDVRRISAAFAIAAAWACKEQLVFTHLKGLFKNEEICFLVSKPEAKQDTMCGTCSHPVFYFRTWEGRSTAWLRVSVAEKMVPQWGTPLSKGGGAWKMHEDFGCWHEDLGRA